MSQSIFKALFGESDSNGVGIICSVSEKDNVTLGEINEQPSGGTVTTNEDKPKREPSFWTSIQQGTQIPCFSDSLMKGMAAGGVFSIFEYFRTRNVMKASNAAVYATCATSVVAWIYCRNEYREKKEKIKIAVEMLKAQSKPVDVTKHGNGGVEGEEPSKEEQRVIQEIFEKHSAIKKKEEE